MRLSSSPPGREQPGLCLLPLRDFAFCLMLRGPLGANSEKCPPTSQCPLPCGPQALLPQIPEPTAQRPPSVDSVTPRTTGLSILLGTSMGSGDTEKAPVLSLHWRSFRKIEVLDADSSKRSVSCLVNCEKCSGDSGKGVLLWGQSHLLPAV